jgi:hypothetical protein
MLRISHCLDNRLIDGCKFVSLTHPPLFTPQKHYYFNTKNKLSFLSMNLLFNEKVIRYIEQRADQEIGLFQSTKQEIMCRLMKTAKTIS